MWVVGLESRSFGRTDNALNLCTISLDQDEVLCSGFLPIGLRDPCEQKLYIIHFNFLLHLFIYLFSVVCVCVCVCVHLWRSEKSLQESVLLLLLKVQIINLVLVFISCSSADSANHPHFFKKCVLFCFFLNIHRSLDIVL
jgi:hypothetical protein